MRLERFLSLSLRHKLSETHTHIQDGKVTVNGRVITDARWQVFIAGETVCFEGKEVAAPFHRLLMAHKPINCVCTVDEAPTKDGVLSSRLVDLVPAPLQHPTLGAYGRLDKNTTGLILLGTDGGLGQLLLSPDSSISKEYIATVQHPITTDTGEDWAKWATAKISQGVTLSDGHTCKPAAFQCPCTVPNGYTPPTFDPPYAGNSISHTRLIVSEGRFHIVKRMIGAVGGHVLALHRSAIGHLRLDPLLPVGEMKELTKEECSVVLEFLPTSRCLPPRVTTVAPKSNRPAGTTKRTKNATSCADTLAQDTVNDLFASQLVTLPPEGVRLDGVKAELVEQAMARLGDIEEAVINPSELHKCVVKHVGKSLGRMVAERKQKGA